MEFDKEIVDGARTRLPTNLMPKIMMTSWTAPAEMKQNNSQKGGDSRNVLKKYLDGKFIYKAFAEDYWLASLNAYSDLGIKPRWIRYVIESAKEASKFL
jgi:O-glycosyl hydrolase